MLLVLILVLSFLGLPTDGFRGTERVHYSENLDPGVTGQACFYDYANVQKSWRPYPCNLEGVEPGDIVVRPWVWEHPEFHRCLVSHEALGHIRWNIYHEPAALMVGNWYADCGWR